LTALRWKDIPAFDLTFMRLTLITILLLTLASVLYSMRPTAAEELEKQLKAEERLDIVHEADDPAQVIAKADQAMLEVSRPFHCEFEWSTPPGSPVKGEGILEAATHDQWQYSYSKRAGPHALIGDEVEEVQFGDVFYLHEQDAGWQKMNNGPAPWRGVVPLYALTMLEYPATSGHDATLRREARERLGDVPVFSYMLTLGNPPVEGKQVRYWIRTRDGLPQKTEETQYSDQQPISTVKAACSFDQKIDIRVPQ